MPAQGERQGARVGVHLAIEHAQELHKRYVEHRAKAVVPTVRIAAPRALVGAR